MVDSFPVRTHAAWEDLLRAPNHSEVRQRIEAWLDRGHGPCWLRRAEIATLVEARLLRDHGTEYDLLAWVVMPNHVHLLVEPTTRPLSRLMAQWKGATSRDANLRLGRSGRFWMPDYYDTWIRDLEHQRRVVQYIESNPVKAQLERQAGDWPWSSARHRDPRTGLLTIPT